MTYRQFSRHDYFVPPGRTKYHFYCDECGAKFISQHEWSTICKVCYIEAASGKHRQDERHSSRNERNAIINPIPPEMLKRLIMLCHPDKHSNSEMSLKATQYLIQMRDGE